MHRYSDGAVFIGSSAVTVTLTRACAFTCVTRVMKEVTVSRGARSR